MQANARLMERRLYAMWGGFSTHPRAVHNFVAPFPVWPASHRRIVRYVPYTGGGHAMLRKSIIVAAIAVAAALVIAASGSNKGATVSHNYAKPQDAELKKKLTPT